MNKPKQERITNVSPQVGALSYLSVESDAILHPFREEQRRKEAITDKFDGITVDTCITSDTKYWETGILREKIEGEWVIVTQYHNYEEAVKGHQQWVAYMKENPDCELKDIDMWNLDSI